MDELELRRRLFSDPQSTDAALRQALKAAPDMQQLQQELLQQDLQIKQALQCDVPEDLAGRLLFNQQLQSYRQKKQQRWVYGLAAGVALALGLVQLRFEPLHFPTDLGGYALAHVYHEASALVGKSSQLPLSQVNALLASFDGKLSGFEQQIRYARFCNFRGVRSLHLVLDTQDGPVTVFVLPKDHGWPTNQTFADDNFHGQSLVMDKADLVLVAAKDQQLQDIAGKLQQQLSFTS
jgi:hypothetical protein